MAYGGARPGAGRKKGGINAMSAEIRAKAQESGELPHEFLLRVSRGDQIDGIPITFEQRMTAATAAAPYFAPKLAQIDQTVETKEKAVISAKPLTPEEWQNEYDPTAKDNLGTTIRTTESIN